MAMHRLSPTPSTVRWGTFDAAYPPLITVNSGDTVTLECVSGGPEVMPPPGSGMRIPPTLAAIQAANLTRVGGHILTGPVAVAPARSPATCWKSISTRSSSAPTGATLRLPPR